MSITASNGEICIGDGTGGATGLTTGSNGQVVGYISGSVVNLDTAEVPTASPSSIVTIGVSGSLAALDASSATEGDVPQLVNGAFALVPQPRAIQPFEVVGSTEVEVWSEDLAVASTGLYTYHVDLSAVTDDGTAGFMAKASRSFRVVTGSIVGSFSWDSPVSASYSGGDGSIDTGVVQCSLANRPANSGSNDNVVRVLVHGQTDLTLLGAGRVTRVAVLTSGSAAFDRASLNLNVFVKPPYSSSPWAGEDSAGDSGSNDLAEPSYPPTTRTLSGATGANFNGTNTSIQTGVNLSTLIGNDCSGWIVFSADTAATDAGANSRYTNPQLMSDGNYILNVGFSAAGVHIAVYDTGAAYTEKVIACGTGGTHMLRWRVTDNGLVELGLDGATMETTSFSGKSINGYRGVHLWFGSRGGGASGFFDGCILEAAVAPYAITDSDFDKVEADIDADYGTSFA